MRYVYLLLLLSLSLSMTSCGNGVEGSYERFEADFFDIFDTHTQVTIYAQKPEDFERYLKIIYGKLHELDMYFDIYNSYDGLNNLKTINDQAGIAPVEVNIEIIKLLKLSREAYKLTGGVVNVALGPVLSIWHSYRENGLNDPSAAALPSILELREALVNCEIERVLVDENKKTVFLERTGMSLDVGAIAKGFAARLAIDEIKKQGDISCLINMGGNVVATGRPMTNAREHWAIGVQDPTVDDSYGTLDTIYGSDISVVTSGDYQRYYKVNGKRYHHIIDPQTLTPATGFSAVTVAHEDPDMADILSTALFILPFEQGYNLAKTNDAAVIWIDPGGSVRTNEKYREISKTFYSQ